MLQHRKAARYARRPLFTKRRVRATLTGTKVCSDLSSGHAPGRIYPQKGAFMIYRTHAVKALTAIGAVILMAGCGSSGGSGGSAGGTGGSASGPVHGGNLTFAAVQDAQSMNATTVFDNNSIWIFEQIFQTLYTVTNNGKSVIPQLATSYKVSADKKTYTFTLRHGVKFSTGKPMTSADVKFSLDQNTKASQ